MFRQLAILALLIAVGGTLLAPAAGAQSSRRSLSQRLEQFRDDLVGDEPDAEPPPPALKKSTATLATPSSAAKNQMPTLAQRPQPTLAIKDKPAGKDKPASQGSSGRTAQPDYRPIGEPAKTADAYSEADADAEESLNEPTPAAQTPTLAKRPEPMRQIEPLEPTPRLARSVGPELVPPPSEEPAVRETAPKRVPEPSKAGSDGDVLFTAQSPQLSVEATGPRKVLIGKPAVFTVKLHNSGEVGANNVVVTLNIPPFAEVVEAQPSKGETRAATGADRVEPFQWKIPRLEAHSRETLALKIIPRESNPIDLAVQWTCSPETSQTLVEVQEPKLLMNLSGPEEVHFGQSKVYKLSVSNPGNGDAENVTVNLLPIGHGADGSASHKLGLLKAGHSKAIEVELTARQAGTLTIRAQAFADGGLRAEAAQPVIVRRANLQLVIDGPKIKYAGTSGTYRIHLTNSGDAAADKVEISAILPPQAKYVSSNSGGRLEADRGKVVWATGSLQPGNERSLEVHCILQAPGENRIQALATSTDELSAAAMTTTRVEALADLKLEIRDPQGPIPIGEEALFEVIVRNRGTKSAENVDLVVFFSEGLEATAVQGGAHEIAHGQVLFKTIATIAAGSETVFRVHARADRPGNHVFRSELVCESLQTKLAAEETTRFYGEDAADSPGSTTSRQRAVPNLQPVPHE